jgi:hypothetical protein
MLTNFLRNKVLGRNITIKHTNEKAIIGSFNKEFEGKVLMILEEMSGSNKSDWVSFANRLKDYIDGDTLMIEEKCKTPYEIANIMSLMLNSNNSKSVRLERDDRRYFVPDISDRHVKDVIYFDKLYGAIEYPDVGEAFFSYMREYAILNPGFNEIKIPMSETKQMMIGEALDNAHHFIKKEYLLRGQNIDTPSSELHGNYVRWFNENIRGKKPSGIQEFSKRLKELGIIAKQRRNNGSRHMRYEIDHVTLYEAYKKKGWINELENIEIPDGITDIDESVVRIPEIEPIIEPIPESPPEPTPEPIIEFVPEPITESTPEQTPEPIIEHTQEIENEQTKETTNDNMQTYLSLLLQIENYQPEITETEANTEEFSNQNTESEPDIEETFNEIDDISLD